MTLDGKTIAILIAPRGTEDVEYVRPKEALTQAGATVVTVSLEPGEAQTVNGDLDPGATHRVDRTFADVSADAFDGLVIPGGTVGADKIRSSEEAVAFVRGFVSAGKPVAAICHGPWALVEADVLKGREVTSYPSLATDIRNAGGPLGRPRGRCRFGARHQPQAGRSRCLLRQDDRGICRRRARRPAPQRLKKQARHRHSLAERREKFIRPVDLQPIRTNMVTRTCAAREGGTRDSRRRLHAHRSSGWGRVCRLADGAPPVGPRTRDPYRRQPVPALDRYRAGRAVPDPDGLDPGALPDLASGDRPAAAFPPARPARIRPDPRLARRIPPRGHHPLRRAARRALFDEVGPPQGLHRQQQRQCDPQPVGRHGRDRHRCPSRPSRHHGGLWLFDRGRAHPRGLSRRLGRDPGGPERARDPLSDAAGLGLSHDQEPRSDPLPVLCSERRAADHRPASGHRLGHAHEPDPPPSAAHQPLRL